MMLIEKSWHDSLKEEINKPYIFDLKKFLETERMKGEKIFPPENEVFNAFKQTPYDQVKVVLMGQDPYHGEGQAHGLCFSVQKGTPLPPSLKNIYKEMEQDLGIPPANHGCLLNWSKQGVLMLNATLTVRKGSLNLIMVKGGKYLPIVLFESFAREKILLSLFFGENLRKKNVRIF